ncbi:MAG: GldG family protein [Acidobacteriia bacterium]|nr:GldG family protein [Terriglobia bacterium]
MAANWLNTRQTRFTAYAGVYIVVILAVLAAVNFLANRYDKSYDATASKQYSLSDQTVKVVKGLKGDVHLTYFGETTSFPGARDLLDRYASLSPRLHVTYIDPERKKQLAMAAGYRADSPVVVDSGVRKEGAKSLTEEEITGALIRSLKSGERNVCVLSAAGEHSVDDEKSGGYSLLKKLLERDNYKVRTVDLKPKAPAAGQAMALGQAPPAAAVDVPKDCTVLVVAGPQLDYTPPVVQAIKAYVEGGGRALIMLDNTLRIGRQEPPAENAELVKLLADWGVTVNKDLVLDLSGLGQIFNLGPEIPMVMSYESHPITQPLTRLPTAFPLSRSLDTKSGDKTSVSKLLGTTEDSIAASAIGPGGTVDPKKGKKGPLTLAAAGNYNGATPGRFVVVGTSLWAQNSLLGSRPLANRDLLANTINWLSSDEDLISIRPKSPEDHPLNMTAQKLNMVFWLSIVIFPLAVVGFGMATWWKRR